VESIKKKSTISEKLVMLVETLSFVFPVFLYFLSFFPNGANKMRFYTSINNELSIANKLVVDISQQCA
jgi:hypothetical protein